MPVPTSLEEFVIRWDAFRAAIGFKEGREQETAPATQG
jgi:hypothetical protein